MVRCNPGASTQQDLRNCQALPGRLPVKFQRLLGVLHHTGAISEATAESELRGCETLLGRLPEQPRRLLLVMRRADAS